MRVAMQLAIPFLSGRCCKCLIAGGIIQVVRNLSFVTRVADLAVINNHFEIHGTWSSQPLGCNLGDAITHELMINAVMPSLHDFSRPQ